MPSWDDLARPNTPEPSVSEMAMRCARVFDNNDGLKLLADLRAMTIDKTLAPGASDVELRELEGERRLVRRLEQLVARGRKGMPK